MAPLVYGYDVVHAYPHDAEAFTQGLIFRDGFLYESTGMEQRSSLRQVELETGRVLKQRSLDGRYFAEGLTDWGGQLIQLTYNDERRIRLRPRDVRAPVDILVCG